MARKRAAAAKPKDAKKQKVEEPEQKIENSEEDIEKSEVDDKQIVEEPERTTEKEKVPKKTSGEESDTFNIVSWNVAGLYAAVKKDLCKSVIDMNPDVMCLQETKTSLKKQPPPDIAEKLKAWKYRYFNDCSVKNGYSGVALLSKTKPLSVQNGMGKKKHDGEGRSITAEFEKFYLVTTYVPNSGRGLVKLEYRTKEWDVDFRNYLLKLSEKKPVILCGDLNVAHTEIDLKNPKSNYNKTSGYTQAEIDELEKLIKAGFVDSYRKLYPTNEGAYTFWSYMGGARAKNVGWRLDYFMLKDCEDWLEDNVIHSEVMGSDHCPIELKLKI